MVTSRGGRRWVFPKGWIDPATAPQAATVEAWEEAGLRGPLSAGPVGAYRYVKYGADYHVTVYLLASIKEKAKWPGGPVRGGEW
ncbi:MAG: NUDIX domain-containing protein [Gemmataceae bacterium]